MAERDLLADIVITGIDAPPAVLARREMSGTPRQYEIALGGVIWHLGAEILSQSIDISDLNELAKSDRYGQEVTAVVHRLGAASVHTLVDIGCNSGEPLMEAVHRADLEANVIGLDILSEDEAMFFLPEKPAGLTYRQVTDPPRLPLEPESADAALALNVIYRTDAHAMLAEIYRGLRPGGVVALSSNFRDHARIRHGIAREALIRTSRLQQGRVESQAATTQSEQLQPPADSMYFPELRQMVKRVPGLKILGQSIQRGRIKVTRENVDDFLFAIWLEASRTDLPENLYTVYRHTVAELVGQLLADPALHGAFADTVHRGVLVVQKTNEKDSRNSLLAIPRPR